MMIRAIGVLFMMSCLTFAAAQENQDAADQQQVKTASVETIDNKAEEQAANIKSKQSVAKAENYRPSETISEDLSVSFPVDI